MTNVCEKILDEEIDLLDDVDDAIHESQRFDTVLDIMLNLDENNNYYIEEKEDLFPIPNSSEGYVR